MLEKIIIAHSYGFCMGVKRAIKIAEETARAATGPVTILNEIVHNEAVVERFRLEGVAQAFSVEEVKEGTIIISAHGIPPRVIEEAEAKGLNVVNATCPLVTRIYDIIKRVIADGYHIIHYGDPNHDETKGVVGHAPERITVLWPRSQIEAMPEWKGRKLAMTLQTTSNTKQAHEVRRLAREKWPGIEIFNTICNATSQLQSAVMDLAPAVDMMLVVGSATSANSKRLASIADGLCGNGLLIGSAEDIREDWFTGEQGIKKVGLSAGASTPDFLVEAVIKRLVQISGGGAEVVRQKRRNGGE